MAAVKVSELKPTDGYIVAGVQIDGHKFTGRMKGSQLLKIADDPRRSEDPKQRDGNTHLENFFQMRQTVQRMFDGAKRANVEKYAQYIVAVHEGQDGMTPSIILYSEPELMTAEQEDGTGFIQIPWDALMIAMDGETQLAARFEAANINPATKDEFVSVTICHGKSTDWARQSFHDLNLLAVRPNAAIGIGMDQRDPLTHLARRIEHDVPFFTGRVNTTRRQLRKTDKQLVTITALRGACITLAQGITGVKYGTRPVSVAADQLPIIETAALEWFAGLTQTIGTALENRDGGVAAAPAVMAALGAFGHTLVAIPDKFARSAERQHRLEHLKMINWTKGKHWEGIAGKFTPKGEFSLGGPKETAYAIYAALSDPQSPGYTQIRTGVQQLVTA